MTLYTIVAVICLASQPTAYKTAAWVMQAPANPSAAFFQAQSFVADWGNEHPGVKVQRWRVVAGQPI